MAKKPGKNNELIVRPDENARHQADQLAAGIGALVAQGQGLYEQLVTDKGQLGFDAERLALLRQVADSGSGSEELARNLVHFREALRALSSVTDIAGLPIEEMQKRVEVLAAVLRRNELVAQQRPWGDVIAGSGRPKDWRDVRERKNEVGRQLVLRGEASALDKTISISEFVPDPALERVLALPEMEGIWHLAIMYAEAMRATKDELDSLWGDLVALENRLRGKAVTAGRVRDAFLRFEESRLRLAGQVAADQTTLASFDTRAMDSGFRRERMNTAAEQIDGMATRAKAYNEAFLAGVQSMLQMKSLTMGAVTDRESMETYLAGLRYLMTIYYMQAAGLAGCLTGAARITGAAMRQYLEMETQRVLGQVGADLGLVEKVVEQVTGEMDGLMRAGEIMARQENSKLLENDDHGGK